MKAFWYKSKNIGDTLTKPILNHFGIDVKYAPRNSTGKFLFCGSIMKALRPNDIVLGAGVMRETDKFKLNNNKILAVRGKLTEKILGVNCGVYCDPALLLPLIYNPKVEVKHEVGIVEHYIDKGLYKKEGHKIDAFLNWKDFIKEIKSCKKIISSSLHGCIIAEAYGKKAEWIKLSNNVLGNGFKFRDYLSATDRTSFKEKLTKEQLTKQQNDLIKQICLFKK
jgi:pyruvyltransferase